MAWRIDPIGPRREGPEGVLPVYAAQRVERRAPEDDAERRERESRRGRRRAPSGDRQPPVEPGHVDVTA